MTSVHKSEKLLTYSIGQVSAHTDLPQSVLRYWETVFPLLQPAKSSGGSRQYSDADIIVIQKIKELLYEKGFTIKGANLRLENDLNPAVPAKNELPAQGEAHVPDPFPLNILSAQKLSKQLKEIIRILKD